MRNNNKWGSLAALSISILLASLGTSIANVGLPAFVQAFHTSFAAVQWIVLSYLLSSTTLMVIAGRLGDRMGRRRLLAVGFVVFTGASTLCGAAQELWVLIAGRILQGAGAALMLALAPTFSGDAVAPGRTGSAMGMMGAMSAVGTALGPTLGGVLLSGSGWRSIFLIQVPLGVLGLTMVLRYLPADEGRPWGPTIRAVTLIPMAMLRDAALQRSLALSGLVATVMMTTLVVGPFYLSRALGLGAAAVGGVMSAGPMAAALAGVPAGRMVDRFGSRRMALAGLLGIAGGAVVLALLPGVRLGVAGYVAPIVVLTAGYALFQTANNTAVLVNAHKEQRGAISGVLNLSRNLGLILGASVMGAVFAAGMGSVSTAGPEEVAGGMRVAFGVAAVLMAGAYWLGTRGDRALPST